MSAWAADTEGEHMLGPEALAERLLDAAAAGEFERELAQAQAAIDDRQDALDPVELFRYRLLLFDVTIVSTVDPGIRHETALGLLGSAVVAGPSAWEAIRGSSRLDELERLAQSTESGIELLELLAYAPDVGMRGFAVTQIESTGLRVLDAGGDSRSYERLLHAIGATEDAYRLESTRKRRISGGPAELREPASSPRTPKFHVIALAGGHEQLRRTAARLLQRQGIETVSIPSSREAVRRERDILDLMRGCDLALILVREITHSTSDQVRKSAEKLGIPMIFSNALSAVAIERQLFETGKE